ncbi:MAG: DUF3179 domain-containing protein [Proteobacteria bacterium]|nr:MAG: DUF3179 domain-containing protein [Pseudomonadota bacterium]
MRILLLALMSFVPSLSSAVTEDWMSRAWPDTDAGKRSVELSEIVSGGPPKDGIPAIDSPVFETTRAAAAWIEALEPVILLRLNHQSRIYPLQILTYHEIVNDAVDDIPVAVTFCPLCNAAIVFDRRIGDKTLAFGTTGLLRHSDLVMYDRQTESWWQQFGGNAIVGSLTGRKLVPIPSEITSFEAANDRFPEARVMSRETGHQRPYGRNPYPGYDRIGQRPFLLQGEADPSLPAMERVLGVHSGDAVTLYPHSTLSRHPVVNDVVGDHPIVVTALDKARSALDAERLAESRTTLAARAFRRTVDGRVLTFRSTDGVLIDEQTRSRWNIFGEAVSGELEGARLTLLEGGSHFAFAWLAFRPDSTIYRPDE